MEMKEKLDKCYVCIGIDIVAFWHRDASHGSNELCKSDLISTLDSDTCAPQTS